MTKKYKYRIGMIGPLWVIQQRKRFLFIPYWKDVFASPFLEEIEEFKRKINL